MLLFVVTYVGSGIYFTFQNVENAFYQLSPVVAILPALILGWVLHAGNNATRMHSFLEGVRHRDILTMCIVFLLAGAFSMVTQSIGSVDATVNLALSLIPGQFLLIGVFLTAAFISTAIGTSMGTIATLAPIAAGLGQEGAYPLAIGMATVVAGAMFGDNLSLISDTTIASALSQEAEMRKKFKLNAKIALIAGFLNIGLLLIIHNHSLSVVAKNYSFLLVLPYLFLIALAMTGINVFVVLVSAIGFAGVIGFVNNHYSLIQMSKDIAQGFTSMHEIIFLSLLVGGLSGLASHKTLELTQKLTRFISQLGGQKMAQLMIAKIVSIFDILLANNTVAIIFSGEIAKNIAKQYRIPPHYSAAWLDIFSCVFQGIIPYGAQILLASSVAKLSPIELIGHVYYCYLLAGVSLMFILCNRALKE